METTKTNGVAAVAPATACYVSAEYLLGNAWAWNIEGWYEATKNGDHRQFVRIRLDIQTQEYVLDVVGQDRKHSESLWRYKGGDWMFLSHNVKEHAPPLAGASVETGVEP